MCKSKWIMRLVKDKFEALLVISQKNMTEELIPNISHGDTENTEKINR